MIFEGVSSDAKASAYMVGNSGNLGSVIGRGWHLHPLEPTTNSRTASTFP